MTATAKTIQIFLPSGGSRGLRIAEIITRNVRHIEIPRLAFHPLIAVDYLAVRDFRCGFWRGVPCIR